MRLQFTNLSKSYKGKRVFENISGQVNDGDRIGLIGANGIGKTTLARLLAGIEEGDTGPITLSPSHMKYSTCSVSSSTKIMLNTRAPPSRTAADAGQKGPVGLDRTTEAEGTKSGGGEKTSFFCAVLKNYDLLI